MLLDFCEKDFIEIPTSLNIFRKREVIFLVYLILLALKFYVSALKSYDLLWVVLTVEPSITNIPYHFVTKLHGNVRSVSQQ